MRLYALAVEVCLLVCPVVAIGQAAPAAAQAPAAPAAQEPPKAVSLRDAIPPETNQASDADAQASLTSWSNWSPTVLAPLLPQPEFKDFGNIQRAMTTDIKDSDIYVIHIVNSLDVQLTPAVPAVGAAPAVPAVYKTDIHNSNWYVYRRGQNGKLHQILKIDKSVEVSKAGIAGGKVPPLYGVKNGYLISVSRLQLSSTRGTVPAGGPNPTNPPTLSYTIVPTKGVPTNVASLKALVGAILNATPAATPKALEMMGTADTPKQFLITVQTAKFSERDLKAPYSLAFTATATAGASANPGDCHNVTTKTTCAMTQTIAVNDVEYWNVGINVVAYGPVEKKYGLSSTNVVTMSQTRHMPLYGVFDVSPWAKKCPMDSCPYFQGGIPLNGSPFHLPYAGIATGLPFMKNFFPLSVYGGIGFMKQTRLDGVAVGSTSDPTTFKAAQHIDWAKKPIYGVEVPVSSIVSKIKSSVGSGK